MPDPKLSKFYVGTVRRTDAERMLGGLADGTFLVRHSTNRASHPYVLSLRFGGSTKHIPIRCNGEKFGLAEPLAFFSLEVGSTVWRY